MKQYIVSSIILATLIFGCLAFEVEDCKVCVETIEEFSATLPKEAKGNPMLVIELFKKYCLSARKVKERLCYFLGGKPESPTGVPKELSQSLSIGIPPLKTCERLKKTDGQICEIRSMDKKQIDLSTVDLKKLKVIQLQEILSNWDEQCDGCPEKADYIRKIEELKPKYATPTKTKEEL